MPRCGPEPRKIAGQLCPTAVKFPDKNAQEPPSDLGRFHPVAPALFGAVERLVGAPQQIVRAIVFPELRDAEAARESADRGEFAVVDLTPQFLRQQVRVSGRGAGDKDGELLKLGGANTVPCPTSAASFSVQ